MRGEKKMRRRRVELAVVLVAAVGMEAREASLRAREPIYCAPIRAGNSTERFLRGVEMTGDGLGAGGRTRAPPFQNEGGAPQVEARVPHGRRPHASAWRTATGENTEQQT